MFLFKMAPSETSTWIYVTNAMHAQKLKLSARSPTGAESASLDCGRKIINFVYAAMAFLTITSICQAHNEVSKVIEHHEKYLLTTSSSDYCQWHLSNHFWNRQVEEQTRRLEDS